MACATADRPAARANASVSLAAASLGTLAPGSVPSRLLPSGLASSHGGRAGAGAGFASARSSSVSSHGGLDSSLGWPSSAAGSGAASGAPAASTVSGATCGPSYTAKPPIIASMSAAIRSVTARFCLTVWASSMRSSPRPAPVRAETGKTRASSRPSWSSRRRRSSSQSLACCGESTSSWLSTTVNTAAWPASGIRYRLCTAASAYFCGSSTQMTMSASLDSRSTAAMDAVTTESWSGRSSRIRPSRSDSPESRTLALAYRWRRCTPSQSSSGAAPCIPHTQACTCRVIGRVTPGGENVAPDSALNRLDFPLPVPPASATTVWLPDRRSRSPARLSTASASSSSNVLKPPPSSGPSARTWASWPWRARPIRTSSASASRRGDRFCSPVRCGPREGSMLIGRPQASTPPGTAGRRRRRRPGPPRQRPRRTAASPHQAAARSAGAGPAWPARSVPRTRAPR